MDPKVQRAGEKIKQYLKGRKEQAEVRPLAHKLKIGDETVIQYGKDKVKIKKKPMQDSYSPEGEETLSEFDSSTSFADRVMQRVYEAIVFDTDRSGSGVKGRLTGKGKRNRGEDGTVKIRYSGGNAGEKGYDAEARVKNLAKNMKAARAKERSGRGGLSVRKGDPVNMRNVRKED